MEGASSTRPRRSPMRGAWRWREPTCSTSGRNRRGPMATPCRSSRGGLARLSPVLPAVIELGLPVSIDTIKAKVAAWALGTGAAIVNDVWGLQRDPDMARVVAEHRVPVIIMHNRDGADPAIDIIADVVSFFGRSLDIAATRRHCARAHRARPRDRLRQDAGAEHRGAGPARCAEDVRPAVPGGCVAQALHQQRRRVATGPAPRRLDRRTPARRAPAPRSCASTTSPRPCRPCASPRRSRARGEARWRRPFWRLAAMSATSARDWSGPWN